MRSWVRKIYETIRVWHKTKGVCHGGESISKPILAEDLSTGVPDTVRPFVLIDSPALPESCEPIARAFWTAIRAIEPALRVPRQINVVFATSPFTLNMPTGELRYTPKPEVINALVNDIVFIDCNKLIGRPFPILVACILEEFVHAWLNIKDEGLTSLVVTQLYTGVRLFEGKYVAAE